LVVAGSEEAGLGEAVEEGLAVVGWAVVVAGDSAVAGSGVAGQAEGAEVGMAEGAAAGSEGAASAEVDPVVVGSVAATPS